MKSLTVGRAFIDNNFGLKNRFNPCLHFSFAILLVLFTSACTKSPPPAVSDLVKIGAPNFAGANTKNFTSATQSILISGNCDKLSTELDYSEDGGAWTKFASNCTAGTFSVTVPLPAGMTHVSFRAKGHIDYSSSAIANVQFLLPPSSPTLEFVQSSASDQSDAVGPGAQTSMSLNMDGVIWSGAANNVITTMPGVVYGP